MSAPQNQNALVFFSIDISWERKKAQPAYKTPFLFYGFL